MSQVTHHSGEAEHRREFSFFTVSNGDTYDGL